MKETKRPGQIAASKLKNVEELLGIYNPENCMDIEIDRIDPFRDHPFKVQDDEKMMDLVESVKLNGVLSPVLLREHGIGRYEMISGHRRLHAAKLAGLIRIPAIIRELTDDEATIIMVDSNIQREELLPSEKAFAYKMKKEAMSHQGERSDLTLGQNVPKFKRTTEAIAEGTGESYKQVQRYIRLTELIPKLLEMTDNKRMHSSYVVTDPKGELTLSCAKMLKEKGSYRIKIFNTINFRKSLHYNPFMYIHSEKDILKLVNTLIANTKGQGEKSSDGDFWTKAEKLYYQALIGYIWYEAPEEEQNFSTLIEMLNASEARENDEEFKNAVDLLFEDLEKKEPDHFAVRQYSKFKLAAGADSLYFVFLSGERNRKKATCYLNCDC